MSREGPYLSIDTKINFIGGSVWNNPPLVRRVTKNSLVRGRLKHSLISLLALKIYNWQVEQKPGGRGRGREWATLGVHPLSWLLSNNRLEKVPFVSVLHTSSNRLLLSNQDKGCTPSVAHSLALPLGPALLNLWNSIFLILKMESITYKVCIIQLLTFY